jgi:hypothetical protein
MGTNKKKNIRATDLDQLIKESQIRCDAASRRNDDLAFTHDGRPSTDNGEEDDPLLTLLRYHHGADRPDGLRRDIWRKKQK